MNYNVGGITISPITWEDGFHFEARPIRLRLVPFSECFKMSLPLPKSKCCRKSYGDYKNAEMADLVCQWDFRSLASGLGSESCPVGQRLRVSMHE